MPQASDEDRARAILQFGSIDTWGPINYLKNLGWTLTPDWCWIKPSPKHEPSAMEYACIAFLIDEWDFGGIVTADSVLTVIVRFIGNLIRKTAYR